MVENETDEVDVEYYIVIGENGCPHCTEAKRILRKDIRSGFVKYYDVDSPTGHKYVKEYDIEEIPFFLCKTTDGQMLQCELEFDEIDEDYIFVLTSDSDSSSDEDESESEEESEEESEDE